MHWVYEAVREPGGVEYVRSDIEFTWEGNLSPCRGRPEGEWTDDARTLLQARGFDPPERYRIVFDTYPKGPNLNLYRLERIFGFVHTETRAVPDEDQCQSVTWSPMLLHLVALRRDGPVIENSQERENLKRRFTVKDEDNPMVLEFLHQKRDVRGVWHLGKPGRANTVLLFGEAGKHLIRKAAALSGLLGAYFGQAAQSFRFKPIHHFG